MAVRTSFSQSESSSTLPATRLTTPNAPNVGMDVGRTQQSSGALWISAPLRVATSGSANQRHLRVSVCAHSCTVAALHITFRVAACALQKRQSVRMTTAFNPSPVRFEGSVADIARDWSMNIRSALPGPPRRIDGYTIGAIPNIDGPGPHGGEIHPDGDEFLYVVSGTMELILDDGDERAVGVETRIQLRSGEAYVVPAVSGTDSNRLSPVTLSMSHLARMAAIDRGVR